MNHPVHRSNHRFIWSDSGSIIFWPNSPDQTGTMTNRSGPIWFLKLWFLVIFYSVTSNNWKYGEQFGNFCTLACNTCMENKSRKLFFIFEFPNRILLLKQLKVVFKNYFLKIVFENVPIHNLIFCESLLYQEEYRIYCRSSNAKILLHMHNLNSPLNHIINKQHTIWDHANSLNHGSQHSG